MFIVNAETNVIKKHDKIIENVGEKNQESKICQSFVQPISSGEFWPTKPAPINAPTTVCVPDMGIPVKDAVIMKMKDTRHTVNIILYSLSTETVEEDWSQLISVIILLERVAATLSEQNMEPTNSDRAPLKMIAHIGIAYVLYEVPRPLDASFAPIEKAIIKLKTIVKMHQISIDVIFLIN